MKDEKYKRVEKTKWEGFATYEQDERDPESRIGEFAVVAVYDDAIQRARKTLGDIDMRPLEVFESQINAFPERKVRGERKVHMGPVTESWPDDGTTHIQRGVLWAFGVPKQEALATPLLLFSFWSIVVFTWVFTSSIFLKVSGISGHVLRWIIFFLIIAAAKVVLLNIAQLAFSFLETLIAARNRPKEIYDHE